MTAEWTGRGHVASIPDAYGTHRAVVERIPAIVHVHEADDEMTTTYVSPQIETFLGGRPDEDIADPHRWHRCLHPDDRARVLNTYMLGRDSNDPFTLEYRLVDRDGNVRWFRDSAVAVHGDEGKPAYVYGVMLDITDIKEEGEQLAFLAYHDAITGLPNRTMFEEVLGLSIARSRRHGHVATVLHANLDNFKIVSDALGQEAGDELLRELADRLRQEVRETDVVARQGNDEFLVLLADLDPARADTTGDTDDARLIAESLAVRIQEMLHEPFELGGTEVYTSASIGISLFPHDGGDAATLLKNAGIAMSQSKKNGPGGYAFHTEDSAAALTELSFATRLRKAVENQNWMLHYQPLVNLQSGEMFGVEALIRWQDPNGGLVPPGEFIPLAEEMGLIEAIGDWVVEEICRQDGTWREEGLELEIGFNLSPRQLRQPDMVDKIVSRLHSGGIDPRRIVVEMTESTAMTDPDRTHRILSDLHSRGLRLAIDDFGTGYSSLSRLQHLPVDILKIDRSFVRDACIDPGASSMVSAIIALAGSLGLLPLAEGIETEEEWRFMLSRGCRLGQGFYFSRPVPAEDILAVHRRAGLTLVQAERAS